MADTFKRSIPLPVDFASIQGAFDGATTFLSGLATANDGQGGIFYWLRNTSNDPALTPDNVNIFAGYTAFFTYGRWIRAIYQVPVVTAPVEIFQTRTVGTIFRVSATRPCQVSYTFEVQSVAAVLTGSRVRMKLERSPDADFSVPGNIVLVKSEQYGIGSGLVVTGFGSVTVGGWIAGGQYLRLTQENVTGSPTVTLTSKQEVTY